MLPSNRLLEVLCNVYRSKCLEYEKCTIPAELENGLTDHITETGATRHVLVFTCHCTISYYSWGKLTFMFALL